MTDPTDKILEIVNSLSSEDNKLDEEEVARLFKYLTDKDTNLARVEKFLVSSPSSITKLLYLRSLLENEQPVNFHVIKRDISHLIQEQLDREVKRRRLFEGSSCSRGFSTFSDIGGMAQGSDIISFPLKLTTSTKGISPGKFLHPPNDNEVTENEVQEYFISECKTLEKYHGVKNKLIVTHSSPLLGTRKPDFVFIQRDSTVDSFNVVVVGEIKIRVGEGFNNTHIGQAISFGEKVLQLQPRREFVYVVLTDCIIIEIFIVHRMDSAEYSDKITMYKYERIISENLALKNVGENKGWRYLVTIMESSPNSLGWLEPSLKFGTETVKLVKSIGVGRTSVVYEGIFNGKSVAVKMAKKAEYFPCLKRERTALQELSVLKSPHIPEIILHNENTLVMTPLGAKIHNLQKEDIEDIIKVLELAHSLSYVHKDLRKYNFIRDESGKIVIIDWGFCIKTDMDYDSSFAGALECMPDEVLLSIIGKKSIVYGPKVDLVCLVRSFYLMLHRPLLIRVPFDNYDGINNIETRARFILSFWEDHGRSDVWKNIYNVIDKLDYHQLIQELEKLF